MWCYCRVESLVLGNSSITSAVLHQVALKNDPSVPIGENRRKEYEGHSAEEILVHFFRRDILLVDRWSVGDTCHSKSLYFFLQGPSPFCWCSSIRFFWAANWTLLVWTHRCSSPGSSASSLWCCASFCPLQPNVSPVSTQFQKLTSTFEWCSRYRSVANSNRCPINICINRFFRIRSCSSQH